MLRKQEDKREEKKATKTMEERKACGLKESVMNEMERQASWVGSNQLGVSEMEWMKRRTNEPNARRQAKEANKTILHFLAVAGKAKEMKSCVCWCGELLSLVFFMVGGLWAGTAANAPQPKKTNEDSQTQPLFSLSRWGVPR